MPWTDTLSLKTGSIISFNLCGSWIVVSRESFCKKESSNFVQYLNLCHLALGSLGLDIVLPEVSLLLHTGPSCFLLVDLDKWKLYHDCPRDYYLELSLMIVNMKERSPEDLRLSRNPWRCPRPRCRCHSTRSGWGCSRPRRPRRRWKNLRQRSRWSSCAASALFCSRSSCPTASSSPEPTWRAGTRGWGSRWRESSVDEQQLDVLLTWTGLSCSSTWSGRAPANVLWNYAFAKIFQNLILLLASGEKLVEAWGLWGAGWDCGWDQMGAQGRAQSWSVLGAQPTAGRRAQSQPVGADWGAPVGQVGQVVEVRVRNHWGRHRCWQWRLATAVRGGHEGALLDHRHILCLHLGRVSRQKVPCQGFKIEVEGVQVSKVLEGCEVLVVGRGVELSKRWAGVLHVVVLSVWAAMQQIEFMDQEWDHVSG